MREGVDRVVLATNGGCVGGLRVRPNGRPVAATVGYREGRGECNCATTLTILLQNKNIIALVVPGRVSTLKRGVDELLVSS